MLQVTETMFVLGNHQKPHVESEKYLVIERYYDNGKTTAETMCYTDACESGYLDGYFEEHETYDLYVTACDSHQAALDYAEEVRNA